MIINIISFLLSAICSDEAAAFSAARPLTTSRSNADMAAAASRLQFSTSISTSNNDVDRGDASVDNSDINRREALARFAASAAAASLVRHKPALAAAAPPTEFSESPTSDSSIARGGYDGKGGDDFGGTEAGSVGARDQSNQPPDTIVAPVPKISLPYLPGVSIDIPDLDPKLVAGAAAVAALAVIVNGDGDEVDGSAVSTSVPPPPAVPYGLSGGRNYWDGVDMTAAKNAGLVAPPPPQKDEPSEIAAADVSIEEETEEEEKPAWKLDLPTPYGIQNADGKNPFIKEVQEYCVGGKVTDDCTDAIKGYLDDLSDTGALAASGDVKAVVGYLNSLGSSSSADPGKKAAAAFVSYLDALSAGSVPPPGSAAAVKAYLNNLNGSPSAPKSVQRPPMESPIFGASPVGSANEPELVTPAPSGQGSDLSEFDVRLTDIEGRVASLESKVDQIPDHVFAKIEAWQTKREERLSDEVKRIIEALAPPTGGGSAMDAPAPKELVAAAMPVPVPKAIAAEPKPAVMEPKLAAAEPVYAAASPLGAIPDRSGMPKPGTGPKKGYGLGGREARWKASDVVREGADEVTAPGPEATSPPVAATPLAGAIPDRSGMPKPMDVSGPKKSYALGGGATWKKLP